MWFSDIPEVRQVLEPKVASANALYGAGTHWLETRNPDEPTDAPADKGEESVRPKQACSLRLSGDSKPELVAFPGGRDLFRASYSL